jgi:hypothetical protein
MMLKKTKKKGVTISRRVETLVEQTDNKLIPLFKWHPRTDLFTPDSIEDLIRTSKIIEKIMNVEGYTTSELVSDLVSRLRLLETHRGESRREFRRAIEEFYSSRVNDI